MQNPFHPFEDSEALYEQVMQALESAGIPTALAFYTATAAQEYAEKHSDTFLAYQKGEINDEQLQNTLDSE